MSFATIYKVLFRRNSVFVGTIFASAFLFQVGFDEGVTKWYENHNRGKLWADVKKQIQNGSDDDEEDED